MNKLIINKGDIYGKLTVIKEGEKIILPSGQSNRTMTCKCECGVVKDYRVLHLTRGRSASCGCAKMVVKGESGSYVYVVWNAIKTRTKINYTERHLYYERGIKVCDEWKNDFFAFKKWAIKNGIKKGLHIDRIDNDKGYEPCNCRFITPKENCNNRRNTFYVTYKGEKKSLRLLVEELSIKTKINTIMTRLNRGWELEDALYKEPAKNYSARFK